MQEYGEEDEDSEEDSDEDSEGKEEEGERASAGPELTVHLAHKALIAVVRPAVIQCRPF